MVLLFWVMIFAVLMFYCLSVKKSFFGFLELLPHENEKKNIEFIIYRGIVFQAISNCNLVAAAAYEVFIRLANFFVPYFAYVYFSRMHAKYALNWSPDFKLNILSKQQVACI